MKLIKIHGKYDGKNRIVFDEINAIRWDQLTHKPPPELTDGVPMTLTITMENEELISGQNGFVWATYDSRQAEIIQNALVTLYINTEIKNLNLNDKNFFLLQLTNNSDLSEAIDFIWRGISGLRLKPDWNYPEGEGNKSFELWLSGQ